MHRKFYKYDLSDDAYEKLKDCRIICVDTETTGLNFPPARLCLLQMYFPEINEVHMVHFPSGKNDAFYAESFNLKKLLSNSENLNIFHYARFDCLVILKCLGVTLSKVVCTKIMSQCIRTYSDKHSLKELCYELLKKNIDKGQQTSDWAQEELTVPQLEYAEQDVVHLYALYNKLLELGTRENKITIIECLFKCIMSFVIVEATGLNPSRIMSPFEFKKEKY